MAPMQEATWDDLEDEYAAHATEGGEDDGPDPGNYLVRVSDVQPKVFESGKGGMLVLLNILRRLDVEGEDATTYQGQNLVMSLSITASPGKTFALQRTRQTEAAVGYVPEDGKFSAREFSETAMDSLVRVSAEVQTKGAYAGRLNITQVVAALEEDVDYAGSVPDPNVVEGAPF